MGGHEKILGLMAGGGTGPELIDATVSCLRAVERSEGVKFDIWRFDDEKWLSQAETEIMDDGLYAAMVDFYERVRASGGVVLRGAVSAPVLYKVREALDLRFKVNPICGLPELADLTRFSAESLEGLRLRLVRENTIGAYHSHTEETSDGAVMHTVYRRVDVERLAAYAFDLAEGSNLALAMPTRKMGHVGTLWERVFAEMAEARPNVRYRRMYPNLEKLGQYVRTRKNTDGGAFDVPLDSFDVVVGPELFMDWVMDDLGWAIHGEPFLGCSGNFAPDGFASYQTVHGTTVPIAGRDMANPIGMIHACAMALRHSLDMHVVASTLEAAVRRTLADGLRTFDIHRGDPRFELVGTRAMAERIASWYVELRST